MFTYHNYNGYWQAAAVTGFAIGTPAQLFSVGWLIPPGAPVDTAVEGNIYTSDQNFLGERDCFHRFIEGDIHATGLGNITKTIVTPAGYSAAFEEVAIKWMNGSTIVTKKFSGPTFVSNGIPSGTYTYPPCRGGSSLFKDISVTYSSPGANLLLASYQYSTRYTWVTKWSSRSGQSQVELDLPNKRYRYVEGSTYGEWQPTYRLLYDSSTVSTPTHIDVDRVEGLLSSVFTNDSSFYFGDLAIRCANDAKSIDQNSIEYLRDLSHFVTDVKSAVSLLKGKVNLKKIADAYLSWKYGVRLTIDDTSHYADSIQYLTSDRPKHDYAAVRASEVASDVGPSGITRKRIFNYKIFYRMHSDQFLNGIALVQTSGLYPSPKNIWEIIPYSFVADWFLDLSNRLDQIDARLFWSTHSVLGTTMSTKTIYGSVSPNLLGFTGYEGSVSLISYMRTTPDFVVLPTFFSDTPRDFHNYVELTALLIQRIKK